MDSRTVILGARGSIPVSGREYAHYGGATTCIAVTLDGETVIIDAGTGIAKLGEIPGGGKISILLTHGHADHLIGLPMCPLMFRSGNEIGIFAKERDGFGAKQTVERLMSPPLWPVTPDILPAKTEFFDLPESFLIGKMKVRAMDGCHPGGVSLLRLESGGKSVVVMTDCTVCEGNAADFADFARGCDLLLCDGQYSEGEMTERKKFGHSTWIDAAKFGKLCGAKKVRIVHHDPQHTDEMLRKAEEEVGNVNPDCRFAFEGEEIIL